MELVVLADLHAENYFRFAEVGEDGRTDRLTQVLSCLSAATSYADAHGATLVLLGDLMSSRRDVDALVLNSLKAILSECPVPVHIVGGNHEQVSHSDNSFETSLRPLADYSKVRLHEEPGIGYAKGGIALGMIPFRYSTSELREDLRAVSRNKAWVKAKLKLFFIHAGLCEERHRYGRIIGECLSIEDLPRPFDLALFGHFHEPKKVGSRVYVVGAPIMHSFKDKVSKRGFLHLSLNPETGQISSKRINLPNPKFRTLRRAANINKKNIKGNYIKLVAPSAKTLIEWKAKAKGLGAKGIEGQVKPVTPPPSAEEVKTSFGSKEAELDSYLKRYPPPEGLKAEDVKKLANEVEYFS